MCAVLKAKPKCHQFCSQIVQAGHMTIFIQQIDRGELFYPSDFLFLALLHIWTLLSLKKRKKLWISCFLLLIRKRHYESIISFMCRRVCAEEEDTKALLEQKCDQEQCLEKIIMQLARKLFNMLVKNYSKEINSQLTSPQEVSNKKE